MGAVKVGMFNLAGPAAPKNDLGAGAGARVTELLLAGTSVVGTVADGAEPRCAVWAGLTGASATTGGTAACTGAEKANGLGW